MIKTLLVLCGILLCSIVSGAQSLTYVPDKVAMYVSSDGSGNPGTWTAETTTVSTGLLPSVPPEKVAAYCSTDGSGNPGTWAPCSASGGGGAVNSVSNSDGTLTITPTTGAVVASLALAHANTWTGLQTFNAGVVAPSGQVIETSDSASASAALFTAAFGSSGLEVTSNDGSAQIKLNGGAFNGIYVGPPFGSDTFIIGETQTAAAGFTDAAAGDTIITALSAKTLRLGSAAGASTVQVTASGTNFTGTISSGGTAGVSKTCGATIVVTNGLVTSC